MYVLCVHVCVRAPQTYLYLSVCIWVYILCNNYLLFYTQLPQNDDIVKWFSKAADLGCPYAAYELWKHDASKLCWTPVEELQLVRRLRTLASKNIWSAQLDLCMAYVNHQYGSFSKDQAYQFVRQVSL